MDIRELETFCETMHQYFLGKDESIGPKEMAYGRMVKLTEEVGELADAVLDNFKRQRPDKAHHANELNLEIADIIIAVGVLAKGFNVDIESALKTKMEKIRQRLLNK